MKPKIAPLLLIIFWLAAGCTPRHEVKWVPYTPEKMQEVMGSGQPVFAYFYAAWCHPCVQLREHTFSNPQVIAALEPYHRIKADMSFIRSPKVQKITQEYQVAGMPTVILFGPDGKEFFHHSGFIDAASLLRVFQDFRKAYQLPEPAPVPAGN